MQLSKESPAAESGTVTAARLETHFGGISREEECEFCNTEARTKYLLSKKTEEDRVRAAPSPRLACPVVFVNIINGNDRHYYVISACSGPGAGFSTFQTLTCPRV